MSKRKFLIPLAAFSLLFSSLVACGGKGGDRSKSTSKPADNSTSQPAGNSTTSNGGGASTSQGGNSTTSQQQAHEHDYELVAGSAAKNADDKDVYVKECKDHDDKYIGIAFDDYSEKSADFGDTSGYTRVPEELRNESHLLAKGSTISWKINIDKAISGAKIAFGAVYTGSDHGTQLLDGKYTAKVNDGEAKAWEVASDLTYDGAGLSQTARAYVTVLTADLVAGENTITLGQGNGGYRLLFGGEVRVHFSGDAKPVTPEVPFEGYNVTFTTEHCKVLIYEGKKYDQTPVETNTTKAMDEDGNIVAYDPEDELPQPQVNFKVVPDDGYSVNATNITVTGKYKNLKQNPAKSETPAVDDDSIFRITKVQEDLAVSIVAAQGEQAKGYKVTFVPTNCQIKVYVGPKNEAGDNLDTPEDGVYYARLKDSPYDIGFTTPQMNFEVVCENGYEFVPEIVEDKVSFISGDYNKFQEKTGGYYNITKVASDLTITIAATQAQASIEQPKGTFFASPELTAGGQLPILVQLGDNNAVAVRVNGQDVPNCAIKSFDNKTGEMVITITGMGDASVQYNPETGLLEKLSLLWDKTMLKYDAGVSMYGNEKLKYWNCDGTTEQLQAEWNRRYGNPWTIDTVNADKVTQNTEHAISGSAMRLRPYSSDRFSLATKDFAEKFNARNISFWVYNSGESNVTIQCFAYTQTGYSTSGMVQPFGNKTIPAGQWTYVSAGFNASDLYGFQIFVAATPSALIFDDICLF